MFNNIGGKIKVLAAVISWGGIIVSVIIGLIYFADSDTALSGVIILIVGPLVSWVGSFSLYASGQLVENSDKILRAIDPDAASNGSSADFSKYEISFSNSMGICDYCDKYTEVYDLNIVYPNNVRHKKVCMDCYNKKISENNASHPISDKLDLLKKMKALGLITEEEYRKKGADLLK